MRLDHELNLYYDKTSRTAANLRNGAEETMEDRAMLYESISKILLAISMIVQGRA